MRPCREFKSAIREISALIRESRSRPLFWPDQSDPEISKRCREANEGRRRMLAHRIRPPAARGPARPVETGDEAGLNRVKALVEDNWNGRGCGLGRECRRGAGDRDNHVHLPTNQIGARAGNRWIDHQTVEIVSPGCRPKRAILGVKRCPGSTASANGKEILTLFRFNCPGLPSIKKQAAVQEFWNFECLG